MILMAPILLLVVSQNTLDMPTANWTLLRMVAAILYGIQKSTNTHTYILIYYMYTKG